MNKPFIAAALCLGLAFASSACKKAPEAAPATGADSGVVARSWTVNAEVVSFKNENKVAILKHEAIPGFMEAMTMGFELQSPELAKGLAPKDKVVFVLEERGGDQYMVTSLKKK